MRSEDHRSKMLTTLECTMWEDTKLDVADQCIDISSLKGEGQVEGKMQSFSKVDSITCPHGGYGKPEYLYGSCG